MESSTIKRTRNNLFIQLFGVTVLIITPVYLFIGFSFPMYSSVFGLLAFILLIVLQRKAISDRMMQATFLMIMNLSIFILNIETMAPVNVIYFVFPLFVSALYYEALPAIGLGIVTAIEILLLAFLFDGFTEQAPLDYVILQIFTFIFLALALTIAHSVLSQRVLLQMEEKNTSMERALNSKEGYLHLFFETAKDAIAVFDADNKIIAINPAFEELYGWSSAESIGHSLELVPPERESEANVRTLEVQAGKSYSLLETQEQKKDGSRFDAEITLSPIIDAEGNVVATSVISRDISYRKEAEKVIIQSEKLKLAGEIAAGVAHEIRNPMTVISGFVQIIENDPTYPHKDYIKLIRSEIERINLIISEFLVLAKPQATERKKILLKKIVDDIALLFGPQLNLHGIVFSSHFDREDYIVEGEEHQLKQVLINLMKNAVEALDGIDRQGEIHMSIENSDGRFVSFSVLDNGHGISSETASLIFEPFYTTKATGTGLGLLVSQKIIQQHGGTLKIKSDEDQGAVATVTLPLI